MDKLMIKKLLVVALIMGVVTVIIADRVVVAGDPCDSTKTAPAVKVVRGPRGQQGPQGPVGPQGPAGQVPTWYLLALGLGVGLAIGLAIGALTRQAGQGQPMVVFNYPPAPAPAAPAPAAPAPPAAPHP